MPLQITSVSKIRHNGIVWISLILVMVVCSQFALLAQSIPEKLIFVSSDIMLDGGSVVFSFRASNPETYVHIIVVQIKKTEVNLPINENSRLVPSSCEQVLISWTKNLSDAGERLPIEVGSTLEKSFITSIESGIASDHKESERSRVVSILLEALRNRDMNIYSKGKLIFKSAGG